MIDSRICALALACALIAGCEGDVAKPASAQTDNGIGNMAGMGSTGGAGGACTDPLGCCAPPLVSCNGACVDPATDLNNCGGCGMTCFAPATCAAGQCACPGGTLACNGACVDPLTDKANCGMCGNACLGAAQCMGGTCSCPPGVATCGGLCVDTQTDPANCGGCGTACTGGKACTAGSCACQAGQMDCDGTCTDVQMNPQHCGECGRACDAGETCMAGLCRGALGADGCGDDALGVTIRQIDSYQSVKVPIMRDGQAVTFFQRNADIIAGHDALFRISVDVDPGFAARELSARVTLFNEGREDQYFAKQRISGSSRDEDSASTFQVALPAERLQMETRYAVELVECGSGTGMLRAPRFPASNDAELEPLTTGVVKIAVVPVRANSRVPDTSEATIQIYRDYFMAMYPISDVEITVTNELSTGYPIDWSNLLDQIRDRRQADSPPDDVYYYGWVKAADTYEQFCSGACTLGIGYVVTSTSDVESRAAVGIAFADEGSAWTMAHEVAHNHGRNHAPCGANANLDGSFPYNNGGAGVWGYDERRKTFLNPSDNNDLMGYCNPKWISDYTFQGLANRIATINGASPALSAPPPQERWHVMLVDAAGARWGRPYRKPGRAFGTPEQAEVLDAQGGVIEQITAYRTDMGHDGAVTVLVPEPQAGWYAVRLQGEHVTFDVPF